MKRVLSRWLIKIALGLSITLGILLIALAGFFFWAKARSYPPDRYAEVINYGNTAVMGKGRLTIVTYNIGYLSGLTNNQAVRRTAELFAANRQTVVSALSPLKPDVIALQEVDLASRRSFFINQAADLATDLQLGTTALAVNWDKTYVPFPYWPFSAHFGRVVSGQALLSRYPIQSHDRRVLDRVASNPFWYDAFYLDRLAQVTTLKVGEQPVVVINVHLEAFDAPTRLRQTQAVLQMLDRYSPGFPVLIVGDFNSPPTPTDAVPPTLQPFLDDTRLRSAMALSPSESVATFPSDRPTRLLDYIFYTPDRINLVESRIIPEAKQASDHLPVIAIVELR